MQFPTWCFGLPAMLKGFFDRLLMPGVAFDISDPAHVKPMLGNIRKIAGVVTYGRPRYMALWMGDPPRKIVTRYLKWFAAKGARVGLPRALSSECRDARAARGVHAQGRRGDGEVLSRPPAAGEGQSLHAVQPPSIDKFAPVICAAASEQR